MAYVKTIEYLDESQQLDNQLMESVNNINKNYLNDTIIQNIQEIVMHSIDRRKEARIKLEEMIKNVTKTNTNENELPVYYNTIQDAVDDDKNMEKELTEFLDNLFQVTPLQQNLMNNGKQNRYYSLYYDAYNSILEKVVLYLFLMIILLVLQIYVGILPDIVYNLAQVILSTVMISQIILQYNDHNFRNKMDYSKYDFPDTNIGYSGAKIDEEETSAEKVSTLSSELCINGQCCPDTMYYNSKKNQCDFS